MRWPNGPTVFLMGREENHWPVRPIPWHCVHVPRALPWAGRTMPLRGNYLLPSTFPRKTIMPIQFTCPHCGIQTEIADEHAGQSNQCIHCGKTITVPRSGGMSPLGSVKGRRFPTYIKVLILLGIVVALLLPAVQAAREAARLMHCAKCVKQINLAIFNYAQSYKCLPPAFIADKNGKPMHSWRVLILPFTERQDLYSQYRFDEPWNSPHNSTLADKIPFVYRCPTDTTAKPSETSYAMIVGPHAISDGPTARKLSEIKDGCSNTIMVAECAGAGINWLEPRDLNTEEMTFYIQSDWDDSKPHTSDISSCHHGRAYVGLGDGSVRCLSTELAPKTLEALMTIDGGENVTLE